MRRFALERTSSTVSACPLLGTLHLGKTSVIVTQNSIVWIASGDTTSANHAIRITSNTDLDLYTHVKLLGCAVDGAPC